MNIRQLRMNIQSRTASSARTLSEMLDSLAQPEPAPVIYTNHETDDHGFPLCRCDACREKSKTRNAQEVARMFGPIFTAREKDAGLLDLDKLESGANGENYETEDVGSSR